MDTNDDSFRDTRTFQSANASSRNLMSKESPATIEMRISAASTRQPRSSAVAYPTPFRCYGDFCHFELKEMPESNSTTLTSRYSNRPGSTTATALQHLFHPDEVNALQEDNISKVLSSFQVRELRQKELLKQNTEKELRVITYRSIALAKPNKQRLVHSLDGTLGSVETTKITSESVEFPGADGQKKREKRTGVLALTTSHQLQKDLRSRQQHELDGTSNYYRQVRVCLNCYSIYSLLDRAREVLAGHKNKSPVRKDASHVSKAVKKEWEKVVEKEVNRKQEIYLRKSKPPAKRQKSQHDLVHSVSEKVVSLPVITVQKESTPRLDNEVSSPVAQQSKTLATSVSMPVLSKSPRSISKPMQIKPLVNSSACVNVDKYLRGKSSQVTTNVTPIPKHKTNDINNRKETVESDQPKRILMVESDTEAALRIEKLLLSCSLLYTLRVTISSTAQDALEKTSHSEYDLILCERELHGDIDGIEFTKQFREQSKSSDRQVPVLCMTHKTASPDLDLYKRCGLNGCIGKPVDKDALNRTVQLALAKGPEDTLQVAYSEPKDAVAAAMEALARRREEQVRRLNRRRRLEAAQILSLPGIIGMEGKEDYVHGIFQLDSDTSIPFCVMGASATTASRGSPNTFFNLVIVHDIFDTWERMQVLLQPIVTRYRGAVQVLLWNYPGQAYSSWRKDTLLNNVYLSHCLHSLLQFVGCEGGRGYFRNAPYNLIGIGNGGSIATTFAAQSPPLDKNLRSLVLLNPFLYVDASLAQFFHDCLKVFDCTPASRPDLPIYFHTRYLFSTDYLSQVTSSFALNLYTAVTNPITLEGRKALCHGALSNKDVRTLAHHLHVPYFSVCASENGLFNPSEQVRSLATSRGDTWTDSISKVLHSSQVIRRTCEIWLKSGHEVLQERKEDILTLLEQLATGFHEVHEAVIMHESPSKTEKKQQKPLFEGNFIDSILSTVKDASHNHPTTPSAVARPCSRERTASRGSNNNPNDSDKWQQFQQSVETTDATVSPTKRNPLVKHKVNALEKDKHTFNPHVPAFERISSNLIYKVGGGSKIYQELRDAQDLPEVKEYMQWRVKRNQARLQRMERKAVIIQRCFRDFYERLKAFRIKQEACAIDLQRVWRAKVARRMYAGMRREDWAVRLVQRNWRGKLGRASFKERMLQYLSARAIERIVRGGLARRHVKRMRRLWNMACTLIQSCYRGLVGRRRALWEKKRKYAAIDIQRIYRGVLGKRRYVNEKEKYLLSRSQSRAVQFGKQMLMEYKLYGTKLQSEVEILAQEKKKLEEEAECVVREICEFDEGVELLEGEMQSLTQLESQQTGAVMTEQARWQLREQKMRLDREFTQMIAQLASRKEKLSVLEKQLQELDKCRIAKEDELRGLEKKLVVLLEEQQEELNQVKKKQETTTNLVQGLVPSDGKGAMDSVPSVLAKESSKMNEFSPQQRKEVGQLMESTETMMKFGFMSMSMTYFSSMNLVRAMRKIGSEHMTLESAAAVSKHRWPEYDEAANVSSNPEFRAASLPGKFPEQEPFQVAAWSVEDIGRWLHTLALGQYKQAFSDAAVDGALLLHLNDSDLKNTLGVEHQLHRKKILKSIDQLKEKEAEKIRQLYSSSADLGDTRGKTSSSTARALKK